jgi:hypothetical protein
MNGQDMMFKENEGDKSQKMEEPELQPVELEKKYSSKCSYNLAI